MLLLAGWLSALAVSVVNACLMDGSRAGTHLSHGHDDARSARATVWVDASGEDAHGVSGSDACAKFCADEAGGVLGAKKLLDLDGQFAVAAPWDLAWSMVEDPLPLDRLRVTRASATRLKPDIPTAYRRLTL